MGAAGDGTGGAVVYVYAYVYGYVYDCDGRAYAYDCDGCAYAYALGPGPRAYPAAGVCVCVRVAREARRHAYTTPTAIVAKTAQNNAARIAAAMFF